MAKTQPDVILVRGDPNRFQRDAAASITPGMLVELTSSDTVQPHSSADGRHMRMVAVESDFTGDGIEHVYNSGEIAQFNVFRPGDIALMHLADGQDASLGDYLVSNGDGKLKVEASSGTGDLEGSLVGMALEAVDMSGSSAADPNGRIKVLIR